MKTRTIRPCVPQGLAVVCIVLLAALPAASRSQETAGAPDGQRAIDEVIATGTQDQGAASVGRNALDAGEQARSIQIFEADFLQEFKPENIEDILILSSNVVFSGNQDGRETSFSVRGFQSAPILRDGFRVTSFGGITDPEIFNLERAEVLKGPDSIVYGEANPGGIINLVTKRPTQRDLTVASLEVGTDGSFSPRFDVNRAQETVSFRVVGLYDYNEDFRDYDEANKRLSLAPSVRWEPRDGTVITYIGEYIDEDNQADFGTAITPDGKLTADIAQVNNHPQDRMDRHFYMTGLDFEQRLSDTFTAEARVRHFDAAYEYSVLLLPLNYDPETNTYLRVGAQQAQETDELAAQINLFGDFDIAGMRNRLTLGSDFRDTDQLNLTLFDPATPFVLDWSNPDYSVLPPPASDLPEFPNRGIEAERVGFFLQNHTNLTDALLVSLGVRYDDVETDTQDYDSTVYQAGIRYAFTDAISVFANYSESFSPSFARDRNGDILPPETGDGFEVGLKGRLFDGRLTYTAAAFSITKNDVAIPDPDPSAPFASIAAGEQSSDGLEIDIAGKLTERLSIIASVGVADTESENGLQIADAADFTSSAFLTYTVNDNWNASFGYEHVGERLVIEDLNADGDFSDQVFLDPHTLVNAAVGYLNGPLTVRLNVSNLFDERYVDSATSSLGRGVHPGAPVQALLTMTYVWD